MESSEPFRAEKRKAPSYGGFVFLRGSSKLFRALDILTRLGIDDYLVALIDE